MLEKARWYMEKTRWHLRKAIFRTYRYLKHPRRLKASPLMRWFARHFLDKHVWRPTQSTFAGGCAIGTFVSAQIIPAQMPLSILLAALFRVNIPVAVVISWFSNPLTFVPIGLLEKEIGDWLLSLFGNPADALLERIQNPDLAKGARIAQSMYLGGVVGGLLLMPVAYVIAWFSWSGISKLLHIPKRLHLRKPHRTPDSEPKPRSEDAPPPSDD